MYLTRSHILKICDFYDENENDQLCLIKCNNADYRASKSAQLAVSKQHDFFFKTTLHVYLEPLLMREKLYFEPSINMYEDSWTHDNCFNVTVRIPEIVNNHLIKIKLLFDGSEYFTKLMGCK